MPSNTVILKTRNRMPLIVPVSNRAKANWTQKLHLKGISHSLDETMSSFIELVTWLGKRLSRVSIRITSMFIPLKSQLALFGHVTVTSQSVSILLDFIFFSNREKMPNNSFRELLQMGSVRNGCLKRPFPCGTISRKKRQTIFVCINDWKQDQSFC